MSSNLCGCCVHHITSLPITSQMLDCFGHIQIYWLCIDLSFWRFFKYCTKCCCHMSVSRAAGRPSRQLACLPASELMFYSTWHGIVKDLLTGEWATGWEKRTTKHHLCFKSILNCFDCCYCWPKSGGGGLYCHKRTTIPHSIDMKAICCCVCVCASASACRNIV